MSSLSDKDKYVVYHGTTDRLAEFALYDRDHDGSYEGPYLEGGITMDPADVPDGTEIQDHFWVELNADREITSLEPAPEMYEEMKEDYQAAAETFNEMKQRAIERLDETDDE